MLALLEARFSTGTHELYQLPLGVAGAADVRSEDAIVADSLVGGVRRAGGAAHGARAAAADRRPGDDRHRGGRVQLQRVDGMRELADDAEVRPIGVEQSNSSLVFGDELVLKVFRRLEPGSTRSSSCCASSPQHGFPNIAPLDGWYEYDGPLLDADARRRAAVLARTRATAGSSRSRSWTANPEALPRAAREPRRGHRRRCTRCSASDAGDPAFAPEEPSDEALSLLTATVDEEIERDLHAPARRTRPWRRSPGAAQDVRERLEPAVAASASAAA